MKCSKCKGLANPLFEGLCYACATEKLKNETAQATPTKDKGGKEEKNAEPWQSEANKLLSMIIGTSRKKPEYTKTIYITPGGLKINYGSATTKYPKEFVFTGTRIRVYCFENKDDHHISMMGFRRYF